MALADKLTKKPNPRVAVQVKLRSDVVEMIDQMKEDFDSTRTEIITIAIKELYETEYE